MGIVKLMDEKTMTERLRETNDPIIVTLEKWTLLMLWHKEIGDIDPGKDHYDAETCAFCESNSSVDTLGYSMICCAECVIAKYDKPCNYPDSVWKNYLRKPCLENARAMVELIERIKIGED